MVLRPALMFALVLLDCTGAERSPEAAARPAPEAAEPAARTPAEPAAEGASQRAAAAESTADVGAADVATMPSGPLPEATQEFRLGEPSHETPEGAPHVVVHRPAGFDPAAPWELVVFLHGWSGCARVLARSGPTACIEGGETEPGWGLGPLAAGAGPQRLFVVPQLAFRRRSGDAGRFAEPGFAAAWLAALGERAAGWPTAPPSAVRLVAHSAGFESALAWVRHGEVPIGEVALMDALYAGTEGFFAWLREDPTRRRLVDLHTGHGSTARQSRRLARMARAADLPVGEALAGEAPVIVMESAAPHRDVPAAHLGDLLRWPLPDPSAGAENQ